MSKSLFTAIVTVAIVTGAIMVSSISSTNLVPYHASAQNKTSDHITAQENISSSEENKALIKSVIEEVFDQRNMSAADMYIAPDLINHNPLAGQGLESLKQYFGMYFTAFPDSQTTIEQILGENDKVLVFLNWTGTHKGAFFGKQPTNEQVSMRTAHVFRIEDSMIAEQWEIADQLNQLRQIGVISFN